MNVWPMRMTVRQMHCVQIMWARLPVPVVPVLKGTANHVKVNENGIIVIVHFLSLVK